MGRGGGDEQIADAGGAEGRFRLGAECRQNPVSFIEADGEEGRLQVVAAKAAGQLEAIGDAAGQRDDVLERAPELHAQGVGCGGHVEGGR